ncbi:Beta-16-galactosyltransferase GALT31A [Zea mays]|uniref:Hexosyltransferase n=1 Tax=Zea mays TaxID=4577 RepID=A0A1D6LEC8_MAIZE|nr:Beta-16-galactosyltransferase GALT31A [Zea mays]
MMAAAALRPHKSSPARVPTRCVAALCAACFLVGVGVVNRYWPVPEPHPGCPDKAGPDHSRAVLNQASQTREVVMALDKTISDIEMRLAAARAAQAMSQGMSPGDSDSEGDQGTARRRMSFVMGVFTTLANRKRRDSIRQTWMPQGRCLSLPFCDQLRRLEDKGVVIRFVVGRSANPNLENEVDHAIDMEDEEYSDILRINHVEGYGGLPMKVQMFLSTALTMWDADFYVKADDNVHVNIGMQRWDPFAFDQPSIVLVHHTVIWGALFNTAAEIALPHLLIIRAFLTSKSLTTNFILATLVFRYDIIKFLSNVNSDSKYYEPDHWKFGTEGNNYFRHATRQLYAVTRDLATYISANRHILHKYSNEDVSFGSWLIGLEVEHVDERSLCCGTPPDCEWKGQAGNPCAASFDWNCTGICNPVERMTEVHRRCWEGLGAEGHAQSLTFDSQ